MSERRFHRPTLFGPAALETRPGGTDPAERHAAAYATARMLVHRGRESSDPEALQRLVEVAETHGLELLAELWADAPADSLPGALWRLYVLRDWIRLNPRTAASEFEAGRTLAPVHEVVAGVGEPPGPDQVAHLADAIMRGVYAGDVGVALERAAAFARVVAVGRASGPDESNTMSVARLVRVAEQLEAAAASWRSGGLHGM